jgi:hypothetical protein
MMAWTCNVMASCSKMVFPSHGLKFVKTNQILDFGNGIVGGVMLTSGFI